MPNATVPGQLRCCRGFLGGGKPPYIPAGVVCLLGPPSTAFSLCRADHSVGHQGGSGLLCSGAGEPHRGWLRGATSASPLPLASTGPPATPAPVHLQNGAFPSLSPSSWPLWRRESGPGGGEQSATLPPHPSSACTGGWMEAVEAGFGRDEGVVLGTCNKGSPHLASPLQVIRPEPCGVCGSRIRFGKAAFKCRQCQLLLHPKCREQCPSPCAPRPRHHAWPREVRWGGHSGALGPLCVPDSGCWGDTPRCRGFACPGWWAQSRLALSSPGCAG